MRAPSSYVGPAAAGAVLLLVAPVCAAVLATGPASGTGRPAESRLLAAAAHGRSAVTALGDDLDVAAARTGTTPARLRHLLTSDPSAWVDVRGHLYYVERDHAADDPAPAPETADAAFPYADTFELHSRPHATRKLYLDFDGHQVTGTAWNDAAHPVINVAAYTRDGSADFTDSELDVVQDVWARVAEDYAPFNIDVTTQDPGTAGLLRTSTEDAAYGIRASITSDVAMRDIVCGGGCAGVAYVGVFDYVTSAFYDPAFVLPKPTYTAAQIAEIVSHEVGHNLGLSHDGLGSAPYYQDDGTKIWSPLMGAGYTPLTQWSNGDYSGATQTQDDFAVIGQNGPSLLSDDYGDTMVTARNLGEGSVSVDGLVTTRTDVDVFAVARSCAGALSATLTPAALGPDLDTRLRLLDANGVELAASSPASARGGTWSPVLTGMDAAIAPSVTPGIYYLEVDGVGLSDPVHGYSDYGSVGRYTLAVTGCPGATHAATSPSAPVVEGVERDGAAHGLRLVWDAPADDGGAAVTSYVVTGGGQQTTVPATTHAYTFAPLASNTTYTLEVAAVNSAGTGPAASRTATTGTYSGTPSTSTPSTSTPTVTSTPTLTSTPTVTSSPTATSTPTVTSTPTSTPTGSYDAPSAPRYVTATKGRWGRPLTLKVSWRKPTSAGVSAVTDYIVYVWKADRTGRAVLHRSFLVSVPRRTVTLGLRPGRYRFAVAAANSVVAGPRSARTAWMRPR